MARKLTLILLILASFIIATGQITYDFENQNLSAWTQSNPGHWEISAVSPLQGNYSLHHAFDTSASWHDQIALATNLDLSLGKTVWQFKIRHGYAPSSSNNWAVILSSDKDAPAMLPDSSFSGYAIGVNFNNFTDDSLKLFRIDAGTITPILNTGINWQNDIGTSDYASIRIIRNQSGQWTVFVSKSTADYDSTLFVGQTTDNTYTTADYFGIYYEYTSAQDLKLWFDDLTILTNYNQNNSTVNLTTLSDTILSTTTSSPGQATLQITFSAPTADTANTNISKLIILPSVDNNISNWQDIISACVFNVNQTNYIGIVNQNSLVFNLNENIAPGQNLQGTLYLQLKTMPNNVSDNSHFGFSLSTDMIMSSPTNNSFSVQTLTSGSITYSVQASRLNFDQCPISVRVDNPFYLKITATDIYGNIDLDANYQVSLDNDMGSGNISSATSLTKSMISGVVEWNDLTYNVKDTFRIRAHNATLGYYYSEPVVCGDYAYYLNDDFEDGDISDWQQNFPGHWQASADNPINGQYSLRQVFDNTASATEWISHRLQAVNLTDTTKIWDFYIRYENASPSSSNNWNVILMSDNNPAETVSFNGYGIGLDWGTTDDLLSLWRIDGGTPSPILQTTLNWQNDIAANQNVHLRVMRYPDGTWKILVDTTGTLQVMDSTTDNTYSTANYFAVRYQYTSSQDRKLILDNIYFGDPIPDTLPPAIDTAIATSADTIIIYFNEPVKTNQLSTSNFTIDGLGNPQSLIILDSRSIKLAMSDTLTENQLYPLIVSNITDLAGNTASSITSSLLWQAFHIISIDCIDSLNLKLWLNRPPISASPTDFQLSPYNGQIVSTSITGNSITITLSQPLTIYNQYTIKSDITDIYHNPLKDSIKTFIFYLPQIFDVIVNELMTDVNPVPPALPPYKYIELYNRTIVDINLSGWTITINDRTFSVPDNTIIPAMEYAIICAPEAKNEFKNLAVTIPVINEYYLTTSGTITIKDRDGQIIESLTYSNLWYDDADKANGGWSLERIDPDNICSQDNNWRASVNPIGGTPGFVNSVISSNKDTLPPVLLKIEPISARKLVLEFNKVISATTALRQINFIINEQATPLLIEYVNDDPKKLILNFLVNFQDGINTLKISNLADKCGNQMVDTTAEFFYESIHVKDIQPISRNQLKIYFSEPVEKNSAEQITNYFVNKSIGYPQVALRDAYNPSVVYLIFLNEFYQDTTYLLSVANIQDLNNNTADSTVKEFVYHQPNPYDVVFNEFMTDVNPAPAGIKPLKYIELLNTREFDIWLENWTVQIDDNQYTLPSVKIPAFGYLILTSDPDTICSCTQLDFLSSSAIKTQASYQLYSSDGQVIDAINLDQSFWQDEDKADGGWSVEKINPIYHCENTSNWTASTAPRGGTPGQRNSVFSNETFDNPLHITSLNIINARTITFSLNYPAINTSLTDTTNYVINSEHPAQIKQENYQTFTLSLKNFLNSGNNQLHLSVNSDCGDLYEFDTTFNYSFIHVREIAPADSNMIWVKFSEEPGNNFAAAQNYLLNGQDYPSVIIKNANNPAEVYLYFNQNFNTGKNTIQITGITDLYGNAIPDYSAEFYYYKPQANDVLINELLFDPVPGCDKYVEIYNTTDYPIYLRHLYLANITDSTAENIQPLTSGYEFIPPHQYLAITTDTATVKQFYPHHGNNFLQINKLPSLSSDQGNIALLWHDSILDYFHYNKNMHSPLIADAEGVALERISFSLPTNSADNWTSAASTVGYGTPAMKNSQAANIDSLNTIEAQVNLSSRTLSPDDDGYEDFVFINIKTSEPDLFADITIINLSGLPVRNLVNQAKLADNNYFRWDGTDDNGQKLQNGIYVLVIKVFTTSGKVKIIRKTLAITTKK